MLIHMKGVHIPDHSQEVLSSRAFGVHSCLISLTNCPGLANVTGNHNHHHYSLQFIDVCDGVNLKQAKWSSILVLFFFFLAVFGHYLQSIIQTTNIYCF